MGLYQIRVEDVNRNVVSFERYKGKVLLIVNTATIYASIWRITRNI